VRRPDVEAHQTRRAGSQAARLLGFDRTGLDLQAAITGQFQSMIAREIAENGRRFRGYILCPMSDCYHVVLPFEM
jgi:hypothetical protein